MADNYDRFLERLIAAAGSLRVGPAEMPGNIVGPVINREAQQRILAVIEAGKQRGDAGLARNGARTIQTPATCHQPFSPMCRPPAGCSGKRFSARCWRSRKPTISSEALALANDSEFALTGGCYSRSPVNIERAKAEMVCGNLYINRAITGAIVERQPFGGFRMSGGGTKAGGREYLLNFLVPRVVTENCLRRGFAPAEQE